MSAQWDERYEAVLRKVLPRLTAEGDVKPESSLKAAGLDSLAMVELLVQVEQEFDVSIPDDELRPESFATPASLWSVVSSLRERQSAASVG